MSLDGRRRRYVPMDVNVAFGKFGTKLQTKWGMDGLCAWMLLLAAAKREPNQGTFTYTSDTEAWTKLGATTDAFDFDAFITFCGRNKQTRKTASGRIKYVEITGWQDWNDDWRREQDNERKSRKRADSMPEDTQTLDGISADDTRTDTEAETDLELDTEAEPKPSADFKIPDPLARLVASLPDKSALTVKRIESMHRKYHFAEADFEEAREAARSESAFSPSAVAIGVLKQRIESRTAA